MLLQIQQENGMIGFESWAKSKSIKISKILTTYQVRSKSRIRPISRIFSPRNFPYRNRIFFCQHFTKPKNREHALAQKQKSTHENNHHSIPNHKSILRMRTVPFSTPDHSVYGFSSDCCSSRLTVMSSFLSQAKYVSTTIVSGNPIAFN